jgi:hypothetical protein
MPKQLLLAAREAESGEAEAEKRAHGGFGHMIELQHTARGKLKSAQRRSVIIASCWQQAEVF